MQELIEVIRTAVTTDATSEQKAAGVHACRTIAAALDSEPGTPLTLPGTPSASPTAAPSLDQVLDLMISKLTAIASEHDKRPGPALPQPIGLRVPVLRAALPRAATRPAITPKAPITRKP